MSKYFEVPYESVPPGVKVWYAGWTQDRPAVAAGEPEPAVIGVTRGALPPGAVALASVTKDPPPPPPPLIAEGLATYQAQLQAWATAVKDTSPAATYFQIPFAHATTAAIAEHGYRAYFATWVSARPGKTPHMGSPWVVGAAATPPPRAIALAGVLEEDPPPPPPPVDGGAAAYRPLISGWAARRGTP